MQVVHYSLQYVFKFAPNKAQIQHIKQSSEQKKVISDRTGDRSSF